MAFNLLSGLQKASALFSAVSTLVNLPVLGTLVSEAESLFPNANSGAQKLAWVKKVVSNILSTGGTLLSDVEQALPAIEAQIEVIVAAAKGRLPVTPAPAPVTPSPAP
jgi:hypothetical protein